MTGFKRYEMMGSRIEVDECKGGEDLCCERENGDLMLRGVAGEVVYQDKGYWICRFVLVEEVDVSSLPRRKIEVVEGTRSDFYDLVLGEKFVCLSYQT